MSFLYDLIPNNFINAFGWTMLHSLWQGALVAIILSIVFLFLNNKSARLRYLVAVGAILFFTAMTIRTFVDYYNSPVQTHEQSSVIQNISEEPQTLNSSISTFENEENFYRQILFTTQLYINQHLPVIVAIYLMGVVFFSLRLTGGFLYSQRIKHHRTNKADENFTDIVNRFAKHLNIKQKVKLLESALVKVPVTIGYLKPVILFPIGLLNGMSYTQIEAIVVHELAHIKRADYLVNFLQSILEIIFFYHPAVWWISSRIRDERENICDDISLKVTKQPAEFAKALFYLNQFQSDQYSLALSAIGNNNHLLRRIKRMTGETKHRTFRSKVYAASLMTLIIISLSIAACSTTNGESYYQDRTNIVYEEDNNGDHRYINTDRLDQENQTYIFYKRFQGEKSKWEATIDNGKLVDLYKDGDRVPSDEYYKYQDMILDEVDDINWELEELHEDLASLKEKLKDIKIDLGENFAEDMKRIAEDIKIEFDSEEFKEQMNQLKKELSYLNKEDFPFNKEEFKREMSQLRDELKDMNFDIDFKWDSDEFKREMKDLSRELANIKVDIDFSGLEESMRELRENMKDLDIDMSGLKEEMKILKEFTAELKDELVSDGVIESPGRLRQLEFDDDAMYVNGKQVPEHLYKKYKEIYKKHYGEYPDGNSFSISDR